ncbi:MAG: Helicase domain protein [candidate division TA06 bacterium 32_111]|uniref:Helicase domain protein n=2 Tax=Bacteria candidate phyla TaxID=1783234 RepID=A0A101I2S4_UNCT6|nr:MAG: Helicase domain protein [candidate division TA06 bacterium 32_111]KUK87424.1 MAG: Helicase domain protein [candidate division TA06 bacterium 34_109]HAF07742.1 helicase [candidate division WOR-3 bacterium]HCP17260.1 helicase [candidate division WOR-3 bacterium]
MPQHSFITNEETLLSDIINDILPTTDELYFLVGYFYFSGYKELYENIKHKTLKILIGMDIEPSLYNGLKEVYIASSIQDMGDEDIREKVYQNYVEMISNIEEFDSSEFKKSFYHFLDMVKKGLIEIRKTRIPNHAKMYIFRKSKEHNENGNYPGVVITGSSNLSISGLSNRNEINVILRDKQDYENAKKIFDSLWENSVEILDKNNLDIFHKKVLSNVWFESPLKPFLLYLRVLKEYFEVEKPEGLKYPHEITEGGYINLEYQKDAINKAISTIKKHNGVIIADVVGLGKSIIAATIANYFQLETVIIAPPHLMAEWEKYRKKFEIRGDVYSSGLLDKAYEEYKKVTKDMLIIIDESHKYRNEATQTYGYLHKLCSGRKVILLTATPFNNRVEDIFSMIKLFQIPGKSTIQTTETLALTFRNLINEEKQLTKKRKNTEQINYDEEIKKIGKQIRNIIEPFIIRRTRIDLEKIPRYKDDLKNQGLSFSEVESPKLITYDLEELTEIYEWTIEQICPPDLRPEEYKSKKKGLIGARYKPVDYLKNYEKYKKQVEEEFGSFELFAQGQRNIASFMRRMLVYRFESSIPSFLKSIDNMINSYNNMLKWVNKFNQVPIYKKGYIPDPDEVLNEELEENIENELFPEIISKDLLEKKSMENVINELKNKGIWFIDGNEIRKEFIEEIERDIKLLEKVKDRWVDENKNSKYEDKKLKVIKKYLEEFLKEQPERKIVIFSQFADTVDYIYDELKDKFRIIKYNSSLKQKTLNKILKNFDAGLDECEQENDYDILISTDAISEGYNLHRAGILINYDIPYNPTKVIQRFGRINRINKKVFEKLYIYNCFPTYIGEEETKIKAISTMKISIIQELLGSDTKILTDDEKIQSFFVEQFKNQMDEESKESWDTYYLAFLDRIKKEYPAMIEEADKIPLKTKIKRKNNNRKGIITFAKKGYNYLFVFIDQNGNVELLDAKNGIEMFKCELKEEGENVSESFDEKYKILKKYISNQKKKRILDKGEQKTFEIVRLLEEKVKDRSNYLKLLRETIEELNGLPDYCMREINKIDLNNDLYLEVDKLKTKIPEDYLKNIKKRAQTIDESKETIILSEEF